MKGKKIATLIRCLTRRIDILERELKLKPWQRENLYGHDIGDCIGCKYFDDSIEVVYDCEMTGHDMGE